MRSLQRWMAPQAFRKVESQARQRTHSGPSLPAYPLASHVFATATGEYEFSVTVWDRNRARAVAGRIAPQRERWILTEVETD